MLISIPSRFLTAALAVALCGCGFVRPEGEGKDPANGTGETKNWAFTIALSKQDFTMQQGATDTVIVTVTRTGGFTGIVNFQAFVPGQGITVTFENITSTGAVTTTRMIVQVGASYPVGTGFGFGLAANPASDHLQGAQANVSLTIVRKPGVFVQNQPTLSVGRGQSGGLRVSLIRTQYDLPVPMSLATTTAGITATFSPNPVVDTVTQMTINVDASVPEGTYNVGVRANEGNTLLQATAPLALTVTPPGSFTINFSVSVLTVLRTAPTPIGLNIVRSNFTGPVSISIAGVPPGATATYVNPAIGGSLSISFASGTAPAGDYPLVVTASAVGVPNATTTLTLRLNP